MLKKFYRKYLFPKEMVESVRHINYDRLWEMGIRGLIFDIDNTLVTFDVKKPTEDIIEFLHTLTKKGFDICFLSNNGKVRVEGFCEGLGYPHIWKAKKPGIKKISEALAILGHKKTKVVIIGDQIFTDCFCGNRLGIYTILTKPIAKRDEWTVKLKRWPEKFVLKAFLLYKA